MLYGNSQINKWIGTCNIQGLKNNMIKLDTLEKDPIDILKALVVSPTEKRYKNTDESVSINQMFGFYLVQCAVKISQIDK